LLAPLGYMLKILTGKKIVVMTHGLDITWSPVLYQWLIKKSLLSMDKVFCVSQNTAKECRQRHIPEEKLHVIPNGVDFKKASSINQDNHYKNIQARFGIDLQNRPVILSVGRMVERKGIHSFLNNIFPLILKKNPQAYYIVVGDGPCRSLIENTIQEKHLQSNVLLTGQIEDKYLENLYNIAQVFVMPNIPVQGDVEGFGIVILEASARGLPVVASKIDGIVDAVKEGCNGILIDHLDYENFAKKTLLFLNDSSYRQQFGKDAQKYTQNTFSWEHISREYYEVIKKLCP
ncbi:MAG: glycosyltransferase family 4 protein, partial [Candidatus Omnitrophica bacterium]|nr:glycosyltransferase family 4 protein [Candidatus Omnitrophota bacterium]